MYTKGTGWVHIPRYRLYIKGPRQRPPTHGGHPPVTGEAFKTGSTVGFKRTNKGKMYRFSFDHAVIENQWNCILEAQRKSRNLSKSGERSAGMLGGSDPGRGRNGESLLLPNSDELKKYCCRNNLLGGMISRDS